MVVSKFDIRQSDFEVININDNLTCEQGPNVCCKKSSTPKNAPQKEEPQKPPKCGQHNPDGLEIRAKNPSDDGNVAFDRYVVV